MFCNILCSILCITEFNSVCTIVRDRIVCLQYSCVAWLGGIWRARGEVVICLDSHVEATPGWLEPLLWRVGEDRNSLPLVALALKALFSSA